MSPRQDLDARLETFENERRRLTAQLANIGYVWHGSVCRSMLTCGSAGCRCHSDPKARHGPYAYWSTKVAGKTVSRCLTPAEANLYEEWIENRRQIERIVQALKVLSAKVAPLLLKKRALTADQRTTRS